MSITARDLFFVLRVRDEASSALNNVSRDLLRVGASAQASSKRAEAAGLRQMAANERAAAAADMERVRILRQKGATDEEIHAVQNSAAAHRQQARAIDASASALQRDAKALEEQFTKQQKLSKAIGDVGKAATIAGVAIAGAGVLGIVGLLATTKSAQEYQRQVALTQTQVDGFAASQKQLWDIGIQTANKIAAPFEQMQSTLYDIFSSTNANLQQGTILLQAFSKAAVAGQVNIKDSADSTMGIMNAFKIPFQDVNKVLDVQFQLVRKGVGTYGQFSSVIGRAVPSVERYGGSIYDLAGSLSFLTRNGLSPAMAAASVARAFDALDNPKAIANMKALGINAYDSTGKLRPFTDILGELQKKILALPPTKQLAALTDVFKGAGGTIQARRFLDQLLIGKNAPAQLKALIGYIDDMKHSTGQFGSAYDKMSKTAAAQTQLLKNRWGTLKVTMGAVLLPVLVQIVGIINKVFASFEHLSPSMQKIIIWGALIASGFLLVSGIFIAFVGVILSIVGSLVALGASLGVIAAVGSGIAAVIAGAIALGVAFVIAWRKSAQFRDLVKELIGKVKELGIIVVNFAKTIWGYFQTYVVPPMQRLWNIIRTQVMPALVTLANWIANNVVSAVKNAFNYLRPFIKEGLQYAGKVITNEVIPGVKELIKFWNEHSKTIKGATKIIGIAVAAAVAVFGTLVVIVGHIVVGAFGAFFVVVKYAIKWIDAMISWWKILYGAIKTAIDYIGKWLTAVNNMVGGVVNQIGNMKNVIVTAFNTAKTWLYNAGKDIINGLIDGIKSSMGALGGFLGGVGSFIKNHKGPKEKDLVMLRPAGNYIMQGLIRGLRERIQSLRSAVNEVNNAIIISDTPSSPGPRRPPRGGTGGGGGKTIQQTFHITTQEINPRVHAADLGWELANRM